MKDLKLIFKVLAKRLIDPEQKLSAADSDLLNTVFTHMVQQVRQGVRPEDATPPPEVSAEKCRDLLKGSGIHHQLVFEREKYLTDNGMSGKRMEDSSRCIKNNNLPPRPTFFS